MQTGRNMTAGKRRAHPYVASRESQPTSRKMRRRAKALAHRQKRAKRVAKFMISQTSEGSQGFAYAADHREGTRSQRHAKGDETGYHWSKKAEMLVSNEQRTDIPLICSSGREFETIRRKAIVNARG